MQPAKENLSNMTHKYVANFSVIAAVLLHMCACSFPGVILGGVLAAIGCPMASQKKPKEVTNVTGSISGMSLGSRFA